MKKLIIAAAALLFAVEAQKNSMKHFAIITAAMALSFSAIAQSSESPERKWGIEADLLVPFVPEAHIITIRGSRTIQGNSSDKIHGDLLLGVYIRPHIEHDIVYIIDEYLFTAGYRQFFWKGYHLEAQLDAGKAWGTNRIDNLYYNNFALLGELHTGYRFLFSPLKKSSVYLNPQVGVIHGLVTDLGPRGGKSDTFFSAKINLGIAF